MQSESSPDLFFGGRPPTPKPMFRLTRPSDTYLRALKSDGPPARTVWDTTRLTESQSSNSLFRVKLATLPDYAKKPKKGGSSAAESNTAANISSASFFSAASGGSIKPGSQATVAASAAESTGGAEAQAEPDDGKPRSRASKYFELLMKHHNKRIDGERKAEEEKEKQRKYDKAAEMNKLAAEAAAMKKKSGSDSSSDEDSEEDSDEEKEDLGALTAYEGMMKVDIEIVVNVAPGEEPPEVEEYDDKASSTTASSKSSESAETPRFDLAAELEQLEEEMKVEEESEADSDDLPDQFFKVANIWDNPDMRWTLGIGGTVFFVPDAERYALAPSLPPPPPPSLLGRRRLRLKPRLPLDISNHRYRDEHPNIWPEDPFSPDIKDRKTFEKKLMTMDFYASCNSAFARLPQIGREKDMLKSEVAFGRLVEREAQKGSAAWRNHVHVEKMKRKKAAEEAAAQAAILAAEAEENARREEELRLAMASA